MPPAQSQEVMLPAGLFGFETAKRWVLITTPLEAPFLRLQTPEPAGLAFLVVSPAEVVADYRPDIPAADAAALGLRDPAEALLLNIVTLHPDGRATVNLKGPLVLNRRTWVGKQSVPVNAADYSTQHPLPTA